MNQSLEPTEASIDVIGDTSTYKLRVKPITTPKKLPTEQQIRDTFQTPRYAVDPLTAYIPKHIDSVWECACGGGRISLPLIESGYDVFSTDIAKPTLPNSDLANFLTDEIPHIIKSWIGQGRNFSIITNPPFSIKEHFIEKCFSYGVPFALLINADYSQWQIDLVQMGCEKLIPTRRISYITPNILNRIHEGEVWKALEDKMGCAKLEDFKKKHMNLWIPHLWANQTLHNYGRVEDVPGELLKRYSASQFHSMWLTWGFGLGKTETFVDLPISEMTKFI